MSKPSKLAAATASVSLSLLFVVVYGTCNAITAQRHDVRTWYYSWERFLPFVPLLIVPYMSLDLFYVAGPFLCESGAELRKLTKQIVLAILVAGMFFLLMPLKFGYPRPQPTGWTGTIFKFLHAFDHPYNLFPSLHITLRTILASLYARHSKGILRAASHVWFSLIGFSALLTGQHHVPDIVGGFILAAFCLYLFRDDRMILPAIPNPRVGWYYAFGCLVATVLAISDWPWTGILLWPALSLGLTAMAYCGLGPAIYQKTGGHLLLSTRLVLAPTLLGQYLSLLYYRRRCDAWSQVTPHVWIGARLTNRQAAEARDRGVTAVLDLTAEFSAPSVFRSLAYCNVPVLDLTEVSTQQLRQTTSFIAQHAVHGGVVYVHCKVGYSRSAAVMAAWLLESGQAASGEQALEILRRTRPGIVLRPEVSAAVRKYEVSMLAR